MAIAEPGRVGTKSEGDGYAQGSNGGALVMVCSGNEAGTFGIGVVRAVGSEKVFRRELAEALEIEQDIAETST